ncbi:hypothetical protein SAMN04488515_1503 [Cognatiyoonia koreensis]|uniref:Uncharacterized protein n=2 Tax=Cognatiyoonia koreensis TaxID=364200 RepID=A0A1I0PWX4_9RHOB|nr:hypothetical protein SAMN04488515_1503 [Cognatiyoonia koreensis]
MQRKFVILAEDPVIALDVTEVIMNAFPDALICASAKSALLLAITDTESDIACLVTYINGDITPQQAAAAKALNLPHIHIGEESLFTQARHVSLPFTSEHIRRALQDVLAMSGAD